MKKEIFEEKTFRVHIGLVLFTLFCFFIIGLAVYCYWKGKVDDVNGYNSIDSSISFIAIGVNILTVIFVYATYQTQRDTIKMQAKQIEDDKMDVEFNRVLDIVYKQLEYTIQRYNETEYSYNLDRITLKMMVNRGLKLFLDKQGYDALLTTTLLNQLCTELDFYKDIINVKEIGQANKLRLTKLIIWNIDVNLQTHLNNVNSVFNKYKNKSSENEQGNLIRENNYIKMNQILKFINADFD